MTGDIGEIAFKKRRMNREMGVDIFVIDPPWPKSKGGIRKVAPNQGRDLDYETLDISSIFDLLDKSILPLATDPHTVFLWGVDEFLHDGELGMEARGYKRHARLIWDKGNGVAPAFSVRYLHEYITWFYKPTFMKVSEASRGKLLTVFRGLAREHSRKPDSIYRMIDFWYPGCVKMDVFSREKRKGWRQWGNETNHFSKDLLVQGNIEGLL
jgi:N6-adenosine-specific RNA methylase IME4